MNDKQRTVVGFFTLAVIVAALFYIPWRIEKSGELRWAPFYRNPVMGQSIRIEETIQSRFIRLKGRRAYGVYAMQMLAIVGVGVLVFKLAGDGEEQTPSS